MRKRVSLDPLTTNLTITLNRIFMARPKKEREIKREVIFRVCLTAIEKNKLLELAQNAGLTPSDFVRVKTIGSKPQVKKATPERAVLIRLQAELNKVGSNANQIARALNRRSDSDTLTGVSMQLIHDALHGIKLLTAHIAKELGHDGNPG
jgi:Bacterial mobilisation protein (MobC).